MFILWFCEAIGKIRRQKKKDLKRQKKKDHKKNNKKYRLEWIQTGFTIARDYYEAYFLRNYSLERLA